MKPPIIIHPSISNLVTSQEISSKATQIIYCSYCQRKVGKPSKLNAQSENITSSLAVQSIQIYFQKYRFSRTVLYNIQTKLLYMGRVWLALVIIWMAIFKNGTQYHNHLYSEIFQFSAFLLFVCGLWLRGRPEVGGGVSITSNSILIPTQARKKEYCQ